MQTTFQEPPPVFDCHVHLYPDALAPKTVDELAEIQAAGFCGIKLHPEYQNFTLDDPRMRPVWTGCAERGLFVFLHAGGERVFTPPFHTSPRALAALLAAHPRLTVAAAHLGGFQMWDEAEETLVGRPIYLDLSHTLFWMPDAQLVRMVRRHGAERILFGTDAPWQSPDTVLRAFLALPFTAHQQRQILWDNAAGLLGLPAPVQASSGTPATLQPQASA